MCNFEACVAFACTQFVLTTGNSVHISLECGQCGLKCELFTTENEKRSEKEKHPWDAALESSWACMATILRGCTFACLHYPEAAAPAAQAHGDEVCCNQLLIICALHFTFAFFHATLALHASIRSRGSRLSRKR